MKTLNFDKLYSIRIDSDLHQKLTKLGPKSVRKILQNRALKIKKIILHKRGGEEVKLIRSISDNINQLCKISQQKKTISEDHFLFLKSSIENLKEYLNVSKNSENE